MPYLNSGYTPQTDHDHQATQRTEDPATDESNFCSTEIAVILLKIGTLLFNAGGNAMLVDTVLCRICTALMSFAICGKDVLQSIIERINVAMFLSGQNHETTHDHNLKTYLELKMGIDDTASINSDSQNSTDAVQEYDSSPELARQTTVVIVNGTTAPAMELQNRAPRADVRRPTALNIEVRTKE